MSSTWRRAAIGAGTATAVAISAGLAFAPAAHAATPTGGLLGGVSSGVTGLTGGLTGVTTGLTGGTTTPTGLVGGVAGTVGDLLTGLLTGTTGSTTPIGTVAVGLGGTTIGVDLGAGGLTESGTVGVPAVPSAGTTGTGTLPVGGGSPAAGTPAAPAAAPAVTGLRISTSVDTVYPAKDGYRDSVVVHVDGTTATGAAQPVNGVVVIKRGTTEVKRWTLASTDKDLVWDGRSNGKVVTGAYDITGVAVDATGAVVAAADTLAVSTKKLVTTSHTFAKKVVPGMKTMAAKPKAGLSKGTVLLRLKTTASGITGKQYLVFSHGGKRLKVRVANGTHTTKAVAIPKSFTTYRLSHTWKRGSVQLKPVVYKYTFKKLK